MSAMPFTPGEEQIVIGDVTYKIRELLASQRSIFLFRTQALTGGSLDAIAAGYQADQETVLIIGGVVKEIIKQMMTNSSPEKLNAFIKDTIKACVISPRTASEDQYEANGVQVPGYEYHFCQYYDHIIPLLSAIYKQNFGGLVQSLKKKLLDLGLITPLSSESEETKQTPLVKPQMNAKNRGLTNTNY